MRIRASLVVAASFAVAAASLTFNPVTAATAAATHWGPVVTVADHTFDNLSTVTTDNGMVVAVWSGRSFHNLYIAVRPSGKTWSKPTKIVTSAAGVSLSKDGKGAWALWQGFATVSALHISAHGAVGSPDLLGPSSDPFVSDAAIAEGSTGAVAAVWHAQDGTAAKLVYRAPGGQWTAPELVPAQGGIAGLVVDSSGNAQVLLRTNNPDFRHQQITYLSRSPGGSWTSPFVVAASAYLTTVAGNQDGDLVVGWELVNGDGTFSGKARYKASGSGFGDTHDLGVNVPENTYIALGIAADGSLASAYRTTTSGSQQIQLTPADSTGFWLAPQNLSLTGSTYAIATNAAGDSVVTSHDGSGTQLVRCPSGGSCGDSETNPATHDRFPLTSVGPNGTITMVWGRGCKTEECVPTRLVAQRSA
jgi:hypothetical protein